uniref:Plastid light harvesting protein n=1 Tax=Attheya septentrionalis TaxID=420275 RepID=A0A7S2UL78_9STRA
MNLSCVTLAALIGAASAFAPASSNSRLSTQVFAEKDDDMSKALPFAARPKILDGALPGDVGFDPFGFAGADRESLINMREAEIKHGRLAMLAVIGWPIAELFDSKIAALLGLPSALTNSGESPSLLNGGLDKIEPEYWLVVLGIAGIFEIDSSDTKEAKGKDYIPGDCGFDPVKLFPEDKAGQFEMQTKEIKHGRIAMIALLGFVVQEALYRIPVTAETPFFFNPAF